jgi:hypothetical protein
MFFIVIPLNNSKLKTFYPWRIPKFQAQNRLPLKNSKLKTFYPWRIPKFQAQNPLPLKNSKLKTFYPWRIPSSKPFTPEEFQALKNFNLKPLYPWRIPCSKPFTPEEFQGSSTGGVRILNGIAQFSWGLVIWGINTSLFQLGLFEYHELKQCKNHVCWDCIIGGG